MVFGRRRSSRPASDIASGGAGHREILEELLLRALERPPCRVAFSGGRDSSAILAAATRIARAYGLDDPSPLTFRFFSHPRTHETEWQELTVGHLGLRHWEIVELGSELDAVGPIAGPALLRHGLYWPPNAHTMAKLFESARGGSLITGNGGDEVFSPWKASRPSLAGLLRARPRRRAIKHGAFWLLPGPIRQLIWVRRTLGLDWLRPHARREVLRLFSEKLRRRDREWREAVQDLLESRYLELTMATFEALAADEDVLLVQPFYDPRFLGAVADIAPSNGFPDRSAAMRLLFGDLLPPRSVERTTKASFTEVFFGPRCRAFAETWDGTGLDLEHVDPDGLRREWSKPKPDFRALTPLQAAWLASGGEGM